MQTKRFEELKVSTRTIIASANVEMEMEEVFKALPLTRRVVGYGGKKCAVFIDTVHFRNQVREQNVKGVMIDTGGQKSFRNALNVVMTLNDQKRVNFKVSKNGKFQITGCKDPDHAGLSVFAFLEMLGPEGVRVLGESVFVSLEVVMTNVDCGMGHCINRQALDKIINTTTPYHSLLETSFGYTGVNIKFPVEMDWRHAMVPTLGWELGRPDTLRLSRMPLSEAAPLKKEKTKYNTFLVFHSGQFIMSGMCEETMKDDYYRFMGIVRDHEDQIREVLDA